METGALYRVYDDRKSGCMLYADSEFYHHIATIPNNEKIIFLGEFVEGMIFYDRCYVAVKVLTSQGVGWMRPPELREVTC